MKEIFDDYVLWPFDKKFIFELVMYVNTRDYTVCKNFPAGEKTDKLLNSIHS